MNFDPQAPLTVDEIIACFRSRWQVSYDLQLIVRKKRLYLQVMWAYLEQQSFPMDEEEYKNHLNGIFEIINRLGLAKEVRRWLYTTPKKPRIGRALTFPLEAADELLQEFLI